MLRTAPLYLSHSTSLVWVIGCTPESEKATSLTPHLTKPCRERKKCLSSLLPAVIGGRRAGNTLGSRWAAGRSSGGHALHLFPLQDPAAWASLRNNQEEPWFILHFQVIPWTFWSKVRWLFFCCFLFYFIFFFSQGFPKWMAVKDFNILQAQQLILKSLAEGFYRGKLGCKSFWRLFPFWNL